MNITLTMYVKFNIWRKTRFDVFISSFHYKTRFIYVYHECYAHVIITYSLFNFFLLKIIKFVNIEQHENVKYIM